ncbi:MAG: tetratricopeptide repeat protein [bacterium]|nr:tetratricopeptide repeat protein [bacterium]
MKEAIKKHSSLILSIIVVALAVFGLYWLATTDNRKIVRTQSVDMTEEVQYSVDYLQKLITASIEATKQVGEEVELDTYLALSRQYSLQGDLWNARTYVERVLEKNPMNYAVWAAYADLSYNMNDYDATEEGLKRAIELLPNNPSYWREMIEFHEFRYPEEAEQRFALLESAVQNAGQDAYFMQELAYYYESIGDCTRAIQHMKIAVDQSLAPDQAKNDLDDLEHRCEG